MSSKALQSLWFQATFTLTVAVVFATVLLSTSCRGAECVHIATSPYPERGDKVTMKFSDPMATDSDVSRTPLVPQTHNCASSSDSLVFDGKGMVVPSFGRLVSSTHIGAIQDSNGHDLAVESASDGDE